jgi:hypothetical protein
LNPIGRGVDLTAQVDELVAWLRPPRGYPHCPIDLRLPNIESVEDRVRTRTDDPLPRCWATVPNGSAMSAVRAIDRQRAGLSHDANTAVIEALHRAGPDMIIEGFSPGPVRLEGLAPGEAFCFPFPTETVELDYRVDDRAGVLPLRLQSCVFLPEERRLYLVHRAGFRVPGGSRAEARLVLR